MRAEPWHQVAGCACGHAGEWSGVDRDGGGRGRGGCLRTTAMG